MTSISATTLANEVEHFWNACEDKIADTSKVLDSALKERITSSTFEKIHDALTDFKKLDLAPEECQYRDSQIDALFKVKFPNEPIPPTKEAVALKLMAADRKNAKPVLDFFLKEGVSDAFLEDPLSEKWRKSGYWLSRKAIARMCWRRRGRKLANWLNAKGVAVIAIFCQYFNIIRPEHSRRIQSESYRQELETQRQKKTEMDAIIPGLRAKLDTLLEARQDARPMFDALHEFNERCKKDGDDMNGKLDAVLTKLSSLEQTIAGQVSKDVSKGGKRQRREGLGLTQEEAAAAAGVSVDSIRRWDRGKCPHEGYPGREDAVIFKAWVSRIQEGLLVKKAIPKATRYEEGKLSHNKIRR